MFTNKNSWFDNFAAKKCQPTKDADSTFFPTKNVRQQKMLIQPFSRQKMPTNQKMLIRYFSRQNANSTFFSSKKTI